MFDFGWCSVLLFGGVVLLVLVLVMVFVLLELVCYLVFSGVSNIVVGKLFNWIVLLDVMFDICFVLYEVKVLGLLVW